MRFASRFVAAVAAVALVGLTTTANAEPFTTDIGAPSYLTLEFWIGPPGAPYDPETDTGPSVLASTVGPLGIHGTADLTLSLDGSGNGTFSFNSSNLILEDAINQLIDLNVINFGTAQLDLLSVGLGLSSSAVPITANSFDLDADPPAAFGISLNQGSLSLHDFTGALAGFGLDDPSLVELTTDPVSVALADLLGFGLNGTVDGLNITLDIPAIDIDLGASVLDTPGLLYVRLSGQINLDGNLDCVCNLPEPGSVALLGMGLIGLVAVGRRRFRRA